MRLCLPLVDKLQIVLVILLGVEKQYPSLWFLTTVLPQTQITSCYKTLKLPGIWIHPKVAIVKAYILISTSVCLAGLLPFIVFFIFQCQIFYAYPLLSSQKLTLLVLFAL